MIGATVNFSVFGTGTTVGVADGLIVGVGVTDGGGAGGVAAGVVLASAVLGLAAAAVGSWWS